MDKIKIKDIVKITIPGSGCCSWAEGQHATVIGIDEDEIYYLKLFNTNTLVEMTGDTFLEKIC
jgi:hypothetical protein